MDIVLFLLSLDEWVAENSCRPNESLTNKRVINSEQIWPETRI